MTKVIMKNKFVKLTMRNGQQICIDIDSIVEFHECSIGDTTYKSAVCLKHSNDDGERCFLLKETTDEILELVNNNAK